MKKTLSEQIAEHAAFVERATAEHEATVERFIKRVRLTARSAFLELNGKERDIMRLRFKDDRATLARFDAWEREERGEKPT